MNRLQGKVAIITGAASGIGLAATERFVAEGAKVLLVDLNEDAVRQTAERFGAAATAMALDVSTDDSAERYTAEALRQHGTIDIALLNAGIEGEIAPIGKASLAAFDRMMAVNVRSVWLGLSALMPAMQPAGGSIVITASIAGLKGTPLIAPYNASKHAVIGLVKSAAAEGAPNRIRVNTVNPGPIDTGMIARIEAGRSPGNVGAARQAGLARIPMARYGRTEEVAALMLFLASDDSSYCTGQTYVVDGGMMGS